MHAEETMCGWNGSIMKKRGFVPGQLANAIKEYMKKAHVHEE